VRGDAAKPLLAARPPRFFSPFADLQKRNLNGMLD
jgi:hypothetical protein